MPACAEPDEQRAADRRREAERGGEEREARALRRTAAGSCPSTERVDAVRPRCPAAASARSAASHASVSVSSSGAHTRDLAPAPARPQAAADVGGGQPEGRGGGADGHDASGHGRGRVAAGQGAAVSPVGIMRGWGGPGR